MSTPNNKLTESVSDGYHTVGELHKHIKLMMEVIFKLYPDQVFKMKLSSEGNPVSHGNYFILGCNTPYGSFIDRVYLSKCNIFQALSVEFIPSLTEPVVIGNYNGSIGFDELYNHRMILFSIICNTKKKLSWKSYLHHDGTMYPDYFIVGINTPEGSFTYHYNADHWDMFSVQDLQNAPEWDGHTAADVTRLNSLVV